MNAIQQHMLDVYRTAQLGGSAPPAPGEGDWQVVREVRDYQRFRAVVEGRPARGRVRAALTRLFTSRAPAPSTTRPADSRPVVCG
ncbi:hypothetical protein [Streptomyces sp. ISL-98]|uniref:hypothetical protein n=1 Tax=Streptomyces sp. ISL-98 TaxID=2819192 RepID=UPI00203500D2|nr:hypothetical protein [Streptomyces sp. ISL-98]